MQENSTLKINHMLKKSIICLAMISAVTLALASSGGGEKKRSAPSVGIDMLKTTPGFSLRAGRNYSSPVALRSRSYNLALTNTVLTYRKGNTIYILPSGNRYGKPQTGRNNLNVLNLKLKLSK